MKALSRLLLCTAALWAALAWNLPAAATPPVIGQWDFLNGDLTATCGQALEYFDATVEADTAFGLTTDLGIPDIGGQPVPVMKFTPSIAQWGGYKMYHGAPPNGGGGYVNIYTLIYDLLSPLSSDGTWRSLFQSNTSDSNDGDFFINPGNGIGISGDYAGNVTPDQWHRIIFAVDLTVPTVTKYIDGVRVGSQTLDAVDGRWSLDPFALLFADENGDTAPGYVSSFQFRNTAITDAEVAALGSPTADKIPSCTTAARITIQPQDDTVTEGLNASFSVGAVGFGLSYQWYQDTALVTDGTNATLLLKSVTTAQAGPYSVVVTTTTGSVTSNPALLTVLPRPTTLDLSTCLAAHLTFDGDFNDTSVNGLNGTAAGSPGFALGQVGSGALKVNTAQDGSSFNYVTLGTAPMAFIGASDFTVSMWVNYSNWLGDPPFISNKNWDSGNNVGFVIAEEGDGGPMKHNIHATGGSRVDGNLGATGDGLWHHVVAAYDRSSASPAAVFYLDGYLVLSNSLADVTGSIDSGLPLNIGQDGNGTYTYGDTAGITNGLIDDVGLWCRTLTKQEVEFTFLEGRDGRSFDGIKTFPAVVLVPPQATNVVLGMKLELSVVAGGTAPLTYQWFHDVDPLPGQTGPTLVINSAGEFDGGPYHVEVSNAYTPTPVASAEAFVNVLIVVDPPQIAVDPLSVTVNERLDATFTVTATGDFLHYQWQLEGVDIPGATNSTLFLPTVVPAQGGNYTAVVTNYGGPAYSAPALLTVVVEDYPLVLDQWDFQNGDLTATCGQALEYFDATVEADTTFGTTTSFGISNIAGQPAQVMKLAPSIATWGGYKMSHGAPPNGGGSYVNKYTLIYDLLYPTGSSDGYRSLFQTSTTDGNDGDFFINGDNGIGISSSYQGNVTSNQWHRVVFGVDLTASTVTKYIDGVRVGNQILSAGTDGRWALDTFALLFADEDGETAPGYVSSFQFRNVKVTDAEVAAMGLPTAAKIPGCKTPASISIAMQSGAIIISHPGSGLEEADNAAGPYTEIVGAPDPYTVPTPLPARKFYRPKP